MLGSDAGTKVAVSPGGNPLRDQSHRQVVRRRTLEQRTVLTQLLTDAGYEVVPSQANFVLPAAEAGI